MKHEDTEYQERQTGRVFCGPGATGSTPKEKLRRSEKESLRRAKKYAMEQCIKSVLLKQTLAHQQQQTVNAHQSVQRQQALSLMCRIYVGSINFGIQEDTVKQAFLPFGPIKSISLPYDTVLRKHKGFAFIEYDIPEAATLAVEQMNGVLLGGFSAKVGRPSNMPQAKPLIEHIMDQATLYNRIYVASLHPDLRETDVCSVFESFGKILSCEMSKEPLRPHKHRGYCYLEYETAQSVTDAIAAMNLFDLAGMHLRVGKCVTPPNVSQLSTTMVPSSLPTASAIAAAAITAKLSAIEAKQPATVASSVMSQPDQFNPSLIASTNAYAVPSLPQLGSLPAQPAPAGYPPIMSTVCEAGQQVSHDASVNTSSTQLPANTATHVSVPHVPSFAEDAPQTVSVSDQQRNRQQCCMMVLDNMVDIDSVDDELEQEVADECGKFGDVVRVRISVEPQQQQGYESPVELQDVVRIFVQFTSQSEMESAVSVLNGRYFAGRTISAQPYSDTTGVS